MGRQLYIVPEFFSVPLLDSYFIFDAKVTLIYVNKYQPSTKLWLGRLPICMVVGPHAVLSGAYVAAFN